MLRLQKAYHNQSLTPSEVVETCLRAAHEKAALNLFITLDEEAIRAAARKLTAAPRQNRPLYGIPIAIKDLFDTADLPTTGGAAFWRHRLPQQDAEVVRRIKAAGGIIFGKTNTHEIALGVTTVNPHYGTTHNPHRFERISGGSSGGSAAAVAAGVVPAALGTDTGGSIRIPASLCGVVGLKPTFGRVSLRGVIPLSWHLDHAGPLTRSVRDAALLLNVLAGYDPADPGCIDAPLSDYTQGLEDGIRGWRIALAGGDFIATARADVLSALQKAAARLKKAGARLETVNMDFLEEATRTNVTIILSDAAAYHHQRLQTNPQAFGADVRRRLETGAARPLHEYIWARRTQSELRRRLEIFFQDWDILLLPTTPITAPPIEGTDALAQASLLTRFTAPFNVTGLPAISLPLGKDADGLPYGIQMVAAPWQEARLLRAAYALENV